MESPDAGHLSIVLINSSLIDVGEKWSGVWLSRGICSTTKLIAGGSSGRGKGLGQIQLNPEDVVPLRTRQFS